VKSALILLPAAMALGGAVAPEHASLTVGVTGLRSTRGLVQACITADPATFPDCQKDPHARHLSVPAGNPAITFANVAPGRYAVALFHDENANGRLDKVLMVPKEGFGFSRDAPVRFGPPRFAAAALTLGEGEVRAEIRMRYLL